MLQLVVEITSPQPGYDPLRRTLSVADLDDKLKHVGHHTDPTHSSFWWTRWIPEVSILVARMDE